VKEAHRNSAWEMGRSITLSVLGLVTLLAVLVQALWTPHVFPQMCTTPSADWEAVLTIGLWLLTLLASLSAAAVTYAQIRPTQRRYKLALWILSIATVPILLVLPSTQSLLGATDSCSSTMFFQYTTWGMMAIIALSAMLCIRMLVQESRSQRSLANSQAKEYAAAHTQLQQLDKQKSEFVAIASHQLRSPLTSVRGYASMLLEETFGKLPKEAKEPVERIEQSARHMAVTIEDYLNVSKIEMGTMTYDLSDFNLADEVMHTCDDMRPRILQDGIVLLYRTDLKSQGVVHADRNKVIQIMHNLIENAHKYTTKGAITVFVREDKQNKKVFVDVIDTGIGMSETTIHSLFEKFSRAEGANKVNGSGSGLGLFVAHNMATAMNGRITAASDGEGKGSRFTLELPLAM